MFRVVMPSRALIWSINIIILIYQINRSSDLWIKLRIKTLFFKGKGLFASQGLKKGDVIFEEKPLVSSQFLWNEFYKYTACEYCLKSLETAEAQACRLTENPSMTLPHPDCCETKPDQHVVCVQCQVSSVCYTIQWSLAL